MRYPNTGPKSELTLSAGHDVDRCVACSPDDFPPYERPHVRVLDRLRAAVAFGVIVLMLLLGSLQGVNAGEPDTAPCASSEWNIGEQWGPGEDDVIGCIIESSGDPVPSSGPVSGDEAAPAPVATSRPTPGVGLPLKTQPAVTMPPTDTVR